MSESMIKNVDQNKRFHDLSLLLSLLIYLRKHTLRVLKLLTLESLDI